MEWRPGAVVGALTGQSLGWLGEWGSGIGEWEYGSTGEWNFTSRDECVLPSGTIAVAMGTEVVGFTGRSGDKLWSTKLEVEAE